MAHSFANLSATDFEELSRDLVGCALDARFEGLTPGPDGGIDGRHAVGSNTTILQAKHLERSSFSDLKRTMRKERTSKRPMHTVYRRDAAAFRVNNSPSRMYRLSIASDA